MCMDEWKICIYQDKYNTKDFDFAKTMYSIFDRMTSYNWVCIVTCQLKKMPYKTTT